MSEALAAVILGVVQGLTEFLPISSSGHLVLTHYLIDFKQGDLFFDVVLHVASLVAVLLVFGKDLWKILQDNLSGDMQQRRTGRKVILFLVIGTLPAAIAGLTAKDQVARLFESPLAVSVLLMINGSLLLLPYLLKRAAEYKLDEMKLDNALFIGLSQALALMPGISRSGATITMAMLMRFQPQEAARFSFLLFIPAIVGALGLEVRELVAGGIVVDWTPLALGFVAALVTGYFALRWLLQLLTQGKFHLLGYYCIVVGLAALVYFTYWTKV